MCVGRPSFGEGEGWSLSKAGSSRLAATPVQWVGASLKSGTFWVWSAPHQLEISPSAIALRSQSHARIRPPLPPMVPSSVPTDNPPCQPPSPPYSKQFQAFLPTFSQSLTSFLAPLVLELRSILAALSRQHSTQDSCPFHYDETDSDFLFPFQPSSFCLFCYLSQ